MCNRRRRTRSDWMSIERARGISVVTSVMTFPDPREDHSRPTYLTLFDKPDATVLHAIDDAIGTSNGGTAEVHFLDPVPLATEGGRKRMAEASRRAIIVALGFEPPPPLRAKNGDPALKSAPHFAPRARLDETKAARQPKLRWLPK